MKVNYLTTNFEDLPIESASRTPGKVMKDYLGNVLNVGDKIIYIRRQYGGTCFSRPVVLIGETEKSFRCVNNISDTYSFCVLKDKVILTERKV